MARVNATLSPAERDGSRTLVTVGATIAALYFGRDIFVPIALAILLSFVLAPGVRRLHGLGLGRVFPVLFATCFAVTLLATLGAMVAAQLRDLAADLPRYEDTVTRKVDTLRALTRGNAFQGVEDVMRRLQGAAKQDSSSHASPAPGGAGAATPQSTAIPVAVETAPAPAPPLQAAAAILAPLVHPLATGGIVVIFTIFILLQREDLRNRLIRLFGASDLQRTTAAIDDGGKRLSRYLLTQSLLNAGMGVLIGLATFLIGVPNPLLWGILFGCMRFVPYVGPIIGGGLPCLFAAAVTPGWDMTLWMVGTVVVLEIVAGQVLEPLLYGHNTGLSPVAVVMAATFWTALWGPIGLLLSTPLTVCLVVIGRHAEQLAFLDVLLGDQPPLTASETFYQRMLANDPVEVAEQARECLKTMTLVDYYDAVMLPGLLLAQGDATGERLDVDRQAAIRDASTEVIEDLREEAGEPGEAPTPTPNPAWRNPGAVLCIGGRGPLDDCAALMLAQVLGQRGIGARAERHTVLAKDGIAALDVSGTRLICLSCFDGSSMAYLRFALRRIRRHAPEAEILIGAWWLQADPDRTNGDGDLGGARVATVVDAVRFCLAAASALSGDELTAVETKTEDALSEAS